MIHPLINRFNNLRKQNYFNNALFKSKKQYAFVGVGMHSLANLYPILHHFGIPLKYICTKSSKWNAQMSRFFPNSLFVHSIDHIISDKEIEGVFVCAAPSVHFAISKALLENGKKVFIEKPPCQYLSELNQLININNRIVCKIGLQRRYWPGNKYILRKTVSAKSYRYLFHFGKYIQGDPFTELFIHAFDYCSFLFGNYKLLSCSRHNDETGTIIQLHVLHSNGVSGLVEVSTQFSWSTPTDILSINCKNELITVRYPLNVEGIQKPKHFFGMPAERLMNHPIITKDYFSASNLIIPATELNTLVLQGFYNEVKAFVSIVEDLAPATVLQNDLPGLVNVYEIIEQIKEQNQTIL